jgi:hypothetical protein
VGVGEALVKQQVKLRGVAAQPCQDGVDLPAVVRLVIEPVSEGGGEHLLVMASRRSGASPWEVNRRIQIRSVASR